MKIKEAIQNIEEIFTMPLAESFDNVGLLCGNTDYELTNILVTHDALESVIEEAIDKNANLVVCFHPIIFSGLKSISTKNYVQRAVLKALENKISIYAIHTAWDNDPKGVNFGICEKLGLINQRILMPKRNMLQKLVTYVPFDQVESVKMAIAEAGAGKLGNYDQCSFSVQGEGNFRPLDDANPFLGTVGEREAVHEVQLSAIFPNYLKGKIISALYRSHPYEEVAYEILDTDNQNHHAGLGRMGDLQTPLPTNEFLDFVKNVFNLKVIRHSSLVKDSISKVGVLGGSGADGIEDAKALGCDIYLTGDVKYHDFFKGENKMIVADIGHFESEQFVVDQIIERLSEKFTKFAVLKSVENTNPVKYFM